jgi:hypothetical protein
MKRMTPRFRTVSSLIHAATAFLGFATALRAGFPVAADLDACNITWTTPSDSSFGSMPLGNGDVGANVWVEPGGDLLFYISKVNAYDAGHYLPKLGRVRITMQPALPLAGFRQSLVLRDGAITIHGGIPGDEVDLRLWVDANKPLIRIEGTSASPRRIAVQVETLRPFADDKAPLPEKGTAAVLFSDSEPRLAWCYRNMSSEWASRFASQNSVDMVAKTKDPILGRTSGCVLTAEGFVRENPTTLRSGEALSRFGITLRILSSQPPGIGEWLAEASKTIRPDWEGHKAYWKEFWERSHIFVTRCGDGEFNLDQCRFTQYPQGSKAYEGHKRIKASELAFEITQRYALERFCEAIASRGEVPPPYNGSIFTMDMPAGVLGFDKTKSAPVSPDGRDWGRLSFMWQNTRHPYWSMATRGDFDTLRPGMDFVRGGLEIARDRCKKLLGIDGGFIMEASWWYNVGFFNWDKMPPHLKYHQLATVEIPLLMTDYYEHTLDRKFLDEVLIPCADASLEYYANRYPRRDSRGMIHMTGVGCVETYQGVTNPCTEIGGMKFLIRRLLAYPIDELHRARWQKLLAELPPVPLRTVRGVRLLAVGEKYESGRQICETPELYSVYPFRQAWIGTPELMETGRQSFHVRTTSLDGTIDGQPVETGGWQAAPVQAASLGLPREAARLAAINFHDRFIGWSEAMDPGSGFPCRPRPRFPVFWECKMDGTPDNDHGANSANVLQSMLLQSDGRKIYLLPAWPEDWDVGFKLHAAASTTVEGVYKNGKFESLKVTPESRRADLVDLSTPEARIKNLVNVACGDRNYLFGLPPMLDGLPIPGPVTAEWLKKAGESITGTRGAPWPNATYRDNTLYLFGFNGVPEIPSIDAKIVSQKVLADAKSSPITVLKVAYDRPLEPIARELHNKGSLTLGKPQLKGEVDFGKPETFDRIEFTIDLRNRRRGQAIPFEFQVKKPDGLWHAVVKDKIYGNIYSKKIHRNTASAVRLILPPSLQAREIHVFPPGV